MLYKGRVRIGDPSRADRRSTQWRKGECMGFTCVVPHRWARMAVSQEIVECLELPRSEYEKFLHQIGAYARVWRWSRHLMFPHAYSPQQARTAAALVDHLKTA
eukprot:gene26746-66004_t